MDVTPEERGLLRRLARAAWRRNMRLLVELHALGFNGMGDPAACTTLLLASGARLSDAQGRPVTAGESFTDDLRTCQLEARWQV